MSETNKNDKRYVKIETRMRDALLELIDQRDFSSISITEITDAAGIGRATFYKHYNDKSELLDAIVTQMISEISEVVSRDNDEECASYHKILAVFTYLDEHVNTAKVLFGPRGPENFHRDVCEILWDGFHNKNKKFSHLAKCSGIPLEYLRSIVQMHFMITRAWLRKDERESPEEMTKILSKLSTLSSEWVYEAIRGTESRHIFPF